MRGFPHGPASGLTIEAKMYQNRFNFQYFARGHAPRPPLGGDASRPPLGGHSPRPPLGGHAPRPPVGGHAPRPSLGGHDL